MTLPKGWQVRGELPSVEFDAATADSRGLFDEDIIQLADPTGAYTIDIGWYPAENPRGQFVGKVVQGSLWDSPEEVYETRSLASVKDWLGSAVSYIGGLVGQPDEIPISGIFTTGQFVRVLVEPEANSAGFTSTGSSAAVEIDALPFVSVLERAA